MIVHGPAATVVTIVRSRVEVWIVVVIVAIVPKTHLLLAFALPILLLKTVLRRTSLSLECVCVLLVDALLLI